MPPVKHLAATVVSSTMIGASFAIAGVAFMRLMEIGSCASGEQQFVVASACPEDTDKLIMWMVGAVLLFLLGLSVRFMRGPRYRVVEPPPTIGEPVENPAFTPGFHFTPIRDLRGDIADPGPWAGLVLGLLALGVGVMVGLWAADEWMPRPLD